MKSLLFAGLIIIAFISGYYLFRPANIQLATVDVNRFHQLTADPNAVIIDVRTPEEFTAGHLDRAVNSDFYDQTQFPRFLDSLNKNNRYLLYCRSGNRSRQARKLMEEKGFTKVSDLDGGITAWQAANLPLIK